MMYIKKKESKDFLSLEKVVTLRICSNIPVSLKFFCVLELLLFKRTLLYIIIMLSVIFQFQVCFCFIHSNLHSYRIFPHFYFHLEVIKLIIFTSIFAWYLNFSLLFLVENYPVSYTLPIWRDWEQTSKAKCDFFQVVVRGAITIFVL